MFEPLHCCGATLFSCKQAWPELEDYAGLIAALPAPVITSSGLPIRFVSPDSRSSPHPSSYEAHIHLTGEVETRPENWHDLFNALTWLTFPKAKTELNARHAAALEQQAGNRQRNRERDMLTLFDESGVIVACAEPALTVMLKNHSWYDLFWCERIKVLTQMKFYLFGHALYEKALQPYSGMTGKGLIFPVTADFFKLSAAEQIVAMDEALAGYFSNLSSQRLMQDLSPIPVLGVPGWWPGNEAESYYQDTRYFRPRRTKS